MERPQPPFAPGDWPPGTDAAGTSPVEGPDAALPPVSSWARMLAVAGLMRFFLASLAYMNGTSLIRFRLDWLRRSGRSAEAEAIVERMTRNWAQAAFAHFGCRVELSGQEHVPRQGPLVVAPNHQSLFDIPLLMGFLGRPVGFVFKRELLKYPGMRYWMLAIGCRAIDRAEHREAAEQYDRFGEELVSTGRALVVFPEGTRSRDPLGRIGLFRRGVLRLAGPRGIPLLPVVIDGTRFLVRPERLAATPPGQRVVRMRILPPRPTQDLPAREAKAFLDELRADMVSTWQALRVQW